MRRFPAVFSCGALLLAALATGCARARTDPVAPAGAPVVLLVSLDGFRADWVEREAAATIRRLAESGVRSDGLVPVFPTKTFTNHYTLATGLLPGRHGIISNRFVDPALGAFSYRDTMANRDPRWWGGEPIWITAERQGVRAATLFWPGSEAPREGRRATDWLPYRHGMPVEARVDSILAWLGRGPERRPGLITLYFHQVDAAAHEFGTGAVEVDRAIGVVDEALAAILRGVDSLGLAGQVDLVIVSDHGMVDTSPERVVFVDSLVPLDSVEVGDTNPVLHLYPVPGGPDVDSLVGLLRRSPHLTVAGPASRPAHWQLEGSPRIAPVLAVADEGWSLVTTEFMTGVTAGARSFPRGNHGYDNALVSMRALFVAVGPRFRAGVELPAVGAVNVYALLAHLLGVEPAPNDGSLDPFRAALWPPATH